MTELRGLPGDIDTYLKWPGRTHLKVLISVHDVNGCTMLSSAGISQHYYNYVLSEFRKLELG